MPTSTGQIKAIQASRVVRTNVYHASGSKIGEIKDVRLDKTASQIIFAAVSFDGFPGIGKEYHLDYEKNEGCYVVSMTRKPLHNRSGPFARDIRLPTPSPQV